MSRLRRLSLGQLGIRTDILNTPRICVALNPSICVTWNAGHTRHPLCIHDSTRLRSRTRWLSGTTVETVMPVTCDLTPKYKHITKFPWLRVQSSRAIASRHWRLPWHSLNVERVSFNRDCSSSYDWRWNGFLRNDIKKRVPTIVPCLELEKS